MSAPFKGLFRREARHATRTFDHGFRWDFPGPDLNDSARALFLQLDRIFEALKTPDHVFLASIDLEVEPGRFPEVLVPYFRDLAWSDTQSYFVDRETRDRLAKLNDGTRSGWSPPGV